MYLPVFSPHVGKCGKNADQSNSEYGHFLRSVNSSNTLLFLVLIIILTPLVVPF